MKPTNGRTVMLAKLALAAGLLGATALGIATAAPLAPQASLEADDGLVTQAKHKNKGGKNHHRVWRGVGTVIVLGAGYCVAQAASCEEHYGEDTYGFARCMRRAGCEW